MTRVLCGLLGLSLALGMAGPAMGQPTYRFTTLDVPGSSFPSGTMNGLNDSGQIVGSYLDANGTHGFLLENGNYTLLDLPGSTSTYASGINASGQIVGYYEDAAGHRYGFLLDKDSATTLDV